MNSTLLNLSPETHVDGRVVGAGAMKLKPEILNDAQLHSHDHLQ